MKEKQLLNDQPWRRDQGMSSRDQRARSGRVSLRQQMGVGTTKCIAEDSDGLDNGPSWAVGCKMQLGWIEGSWQVGFDDLIWAWWICSQEEIHESCSIYRWCGQRHHNGNTRVFHGA